MKFDNKVSLRVNIYNVLHGINTNACRPNSWVVNFPKKEKKN